MAATKKQGAAKGSLLCDDDDDVVMKSTGQPVTEDEGAMKNASDDSSRKKSPAKESPEEMAFRMAKVLLAEGLVDVSAHTGAHQNIPVDTVLGATNNNVAPSVSVDDEDSPIVVTPSLVSLSDRFFFWRELAPGNQREQGATSTIATNASHGKTGGQNRGLGGDLTREDEELDEDAGLVDVGEAEVGDLGDDDDDATPPTTPPSRRPWGSAPLSGPGSSTALRNAVHRLEDQLEAENSRGSSNGGTSDSGKKSPSLDEVERRTVAALTDLVLNHEMHGASGIAGIGDLYESTSSAHDAVLLLGQSIPRRVCQHPFRRNDIVWVCRTCQSDETCVLCHACFVASNHEGHDVAFYHAQAGGCCDCGDPDAWDPSGFCHRHGPNVALSEGDLGGMGMGTVLAVSGAVTACAEWLVQVVAEGIERGYRRANPIRRNTGHASPVSISAVLASKTNKCDSQGVTALSTSSASAATGSDVAVAGLPSSSNSNSDAPRGIVAMRQWARAEASSNAFNPPAETFTFDPADDAESKSIASMSLDAPADAPKVSDGEVFDPAAASKLKRIDTSDGGNAEKPSASPAQLLGEVGRRENGLFLVLHADDVHSSADIIAGLRELYCGATEAPPPYGTHHQTENVLSKIARIVRTNGDVIVWGTQELLAVCGPVIGSCWRDGDWIASTRVGGMMLEKARILTRRGLVCTIKTRDELRVEQRAAAVINWLSVLARSCDPLCDKVSIALSGGRRLVPMLLVDLKLSRRIVIKWHSLLLTLLAVPSFKAALANAYCDTYRTVTTEYARGVGILERSSYTLSVQFLNRVTYVQDLVRERDLLGTLCRSLFETLRLAACPSPTLGSGSPGTPSAMPALGAFNDLLSPWSPTSEDSSVRARVGLARSLSRSAKVSVSDSSSELATLNPMHHVLTHRRYGPCISDLKCVLNVPGMAREFASVSVVDGVRVAKDAGSCLESWVRALSLGQMMDGQVWRSWGQGHVETEPRGWVGAFNFSISLGSLFERLLCWEDNDVSPIADSERKHPRALLRCIELTHYIMTTGLYAWQQSEVARYRSSAYATNLSPHARSPASLPFSTVAVNCGTTLAMAALPVAQIQPWSFHLPLHRFAAACLREVSRRPISDAGDGDGLDGLLSKLGKFENHRELFRGILEFPVLVLSRAAQIRAGLWKRNGPGMLDQVLNYAEPPFCRTLRDADLTLLQFAMLGFGKGGEDDKSEERSSGCAYLINLLLHRFGVFDFAGLAKAPTANCAQYTEEVREGLYPAEEAGDESSRKNSLMADEDVPEAVPSLVLPWTYTPAKDASALLSLLEELFQLLIIFITELPLPGVTESSEAIAQAKSRLRREVIHRLTSGSKTHSELAEVHHVLPLRDNSILSGEGKLLNPDDATGAALEAALGEVAIRKSSRGKLAPDQWELKREAWSEYDPAFFHMSLRNHQSAAENRPSQESETQAFSPKPAKAHEFFARIRRDVTADASVLALAYRTLHVHCRQIKGDRNMLGLRGKVAYDRDAMSETVLARAIHLLSLGVYAWQSDLEEAQSVHKEWRDQGGGDIGSVFCLATDAPGPRDWVEKVLLEEPSKIMDSDWYKGEENALTLLYRLWKEGGCVGGFIAQDRAVRAGAGWICEYAASCHPEAAKFMGLGSSETNASTGSSGESELERRKREAKERAMEQMKANAAKFAAMMSSSFGTDGDDDEDGDEAFTDLGPQSVKVGQLDSKDSLVEPMQLETQNVSRVSENADTNLSARGIRGSLLSERPQCVICGHMASPSDAEKEVKRSRGDEQDKTLAFCAYVQASTVLKGGGLPPPPAAQDSSSLTHRFVGAHLTLCGHAVHSSCCESYLKTVAQREERLADRLEGGKKGEFLCPLCQRLSNCLVPFIDVGADWVEDPVISDAVCESGDETSPQYVDQKIELDSFLSSSKWVLGRVKNNGTWDGRCTFVSNEEGSPNGNSRADNSSRGLQQKLSLRKSVRTFGKKDLVLAWNAAMKTTRFGRKRRVLENADGSQPDGSSGLENDPVRIVDSSDSSGATEVWRKLMDQIADAAYRGDAKRLQHGDESPLEDYGEFRHYLTEGAAYNLGNRELGRDSVEWPACLFENGTPSGRKQELSREKLISKLLQATQSLTYSSCAEMLEIRRMCRTRMAGLTNGDGDQLQSLHSKFGVRAITCDYNLVLLPDPVVGVDGGTQPFEGRLGKLRYFGLAVMAASSPVAREIVQLSLDLPMSTEVGGLVATSFVGSAEATGVVRAPIVYPLLTGHVLSHVVAAMCCTCGRARTLNDSLEGTSQGAVHDVDVAEAGVFGVMRDCENFIRLGFLARVLQATLGRVLMDPHDTPATEELLSKREEAVLHVSRCLSGDRSSGSFQDLFKFGVAKLVSVALCSRDGAASSADEMDDGTSDKTATEDGSLEDVFSDAIDHAKVEGGLFLSEALLILQVLVPSASKVLRERHNSTSAASTQEDHVQVLMRIAGVDSMEEMSSSTLIHEVVKQWYGTARPLRLSPSFSPNDAWKRRRDDILCGQKLFRCQDWPLMLTSEIDSSQVAMQPLQDRSSHDKPVAAAEGLKIFPPTYSSEKSVPLLGGVRLERGDDRRPFMTRLPTSYTDLYAELGALFPDSEKTALCLVCGDVLNAGGKGECTKHAFRCGGGAGIFFLLQECTGLILHGYKAAYVNSPYVDSHGETPQYRGRPLNLDLDRYEVLHELWSGHLVREKVIAERASSRQVIIANFY